MCKLHNQIQEKLQLLSTVESEEDRQRIQTEILNLQQQINKVADERQGLNQGNGQAQSPLSGMGNRFLNGIHTFTEVLLETQRHIHHS